MGEEETNWGEEGALGEDAISRSERDRSHGGRVERESESALGDMLGQSIAEQAWPGIFSGGKQIIRTEMTGYEEKTGPNRVLSLYFSDNSAMAIIGDFAVRYKSPQSEQPMSLEDVLDGEVISEEDLTGNAS